MTLAFMQLTRDHVVVLSLCNPVREDNMIVAPFDSPVNVRVKDGGGTVCVRDAMSAAEVLLRRWPAEHESPWRLRAIAKCLGAMEGQCSASAVREAFLLAAATARILVRPDRKASGTVDQSL